MKVQDFVREQIQLSGQTIGALLVEMVQLCLTSLSKHFIKKCLH